MDGRFEVFTDNDGSIRFRLTDVDGAGFVVSGGFQCTRDAALGVAIVREIAGTGLIVDRTNEAARSVDPPAPAAQHAPELVRA
ncbi:YegP family protein [Pseudarthrobacter sp. P1]|uniref:YegP family protein n=1 Tax=Pseudarthrobacter sp. P1 TaxID=3418418 RepID=UPI003CF9E05F